nr:putative F-box protein At1g19160 [Ipomoea batatas]
MKRLQSTDVNLQIAESAILIWGDLVSSDIAMIISPEIIFDVLIFNPFTREVKVLPFIKEPEKPPNKESLRIQFGFGLSNNITWKIIMLLSFEDSNLKMGGSHHDIVMVCSQSFKGHLVWFDMDDEVFGKIALPSNVEVLDHYTVMNESIALFTILESEWPFALVSGPREVRALDASSPEGFS